MSWGGTAVKKVGIGLGGWQIVIIHPGCQIKEYH